MLNCAIGRTVQVTSELPQYQKLLRPLMNSKTGAPLMYPDFKELLSKLNEHKAKYLIIGGYAVGFHAEPRATKDIDILIGTDAKNAKAVFAALVSFDAPLEGITPADLIEKDSFFRMGSPPWMVDIIPEAKGVDFNKAWDRRIKMPVDK